MSTDAKKIQQMSHKHTTNEWFGVITGWQKGVFAAIVVSFVLGAFAFTYQNVSLPKDSRRMDLIQQDVKEIKQYIGIDAVDKAITKSDIVVTKDNVKDIKIDINELRSDIKALIGLVKQVNNNTK